MPYLVGGLGCVGVAIAIALSELGVNEPSAVMLYLVPVIFCATRWGAGPALFSVVVAYVLQDYYFAPPLRSFGITRREDIIAVSMFLLTALTTGHLSAAARRASQRAREADVLRRSNELKEVLLSSVSHDLRTPLASIKASVGTLLEEHIELRPEQQRELLAGIEEETDRLSRLISNLLDISRLEAGQMPADRELNAIAEVATGVVDRLAWVLRDHPVEIDIPDDIPLVPFDYVHVQQVLTNLLENAALHTPPGTRVRVCARQEGNAVAVRVSDDGPGIPASERERIFDKFYHGGRSGRRGSGLGLAIARGLAEAQGGSLKLDVQSPRGATFVFTLPLMTDKL